MIYHSHHSGLQRYSQKCNYLNVAFLQLPSLRFYRYFIQYSSLLVEKDLQCNDSIAKLRGFSSPRNPSAWHWHTVNLLCDLCPVLHHCNYYSDFLQIFAWCLLLLLFTFFLSVLPICSETRCDKGSRWFLDEHFVVVTHAVVVVVSFFFF